VTFLFHGVEDSECDDGRPGTPTARIVGVQWAQVSGQSPLTMVVTVLTGEIPSNFRISHVTVIYHLSTPGSVADPGGSANTDSNGHATINWSEAGLKRASAAIGSGSDWQYNAVATFNFFFATLSGQTWDAAAEMIE
jgi:hypothetical protein